MGEHKHVNNCIFAFDEIRMIRLKTVFSDVKPETLYDVLHDPDYRKTWDKHMLESKELGMLNPNNDLSYYQSIVRPLSKTEILFSSGHGYRRQASLTSSTTAFTIARSLPRRVSSEEYPTSLGYW